MEERVKVVHVIDGLGWAGMEQMVASLVRRIDKSRFDVTLLSELPMKESVRDQVDFLRSEGVKVAFLQEGKRKKFLALDYCRLLKKLKPGVVHSHSGVWRDSCLGAAMAGVPLIFHTEHGRVFLEDNARARWTHRFLTMFRDRLVAVSDELKSFLIDHVGLPGSKIVTIHNGIDDQVFKPGLGDAGLRSEIGMEDNDVLIMAVGRINPIKDYETMIRAISEVRHSIVGGDRSFKLAVVGPETVDHLSGGGLLEKLVALRDELGVGTEVRFIGKRTNIPALLCEADIFMQTSITEGLSMSIMEAMACGKGVVVTDVGGNRELVVDGITGFLAPMGDYRELAGGLVKLIIDERVRQEMGVAGRRRIMEGFTLDHMARKYEALYVPFREED